MVKFQKKKEVIDVHPSADSSHYNGTAYRLSISEHLLLPFLAGDTLRLQNPDLERIVRPSNMLLTRLDGLFQTAGCENKSKSVTSVKKWNKGFVLKQWRHDDVTNCAIDHVLRRSSKRCRRCPMVE